MMYTIHLTAGHTISSKSGMKEQPSMKIAFVESFRGAILSVFIVQVGVFWRHVNVSMLYP